MHFDRRSFLTACSGAGITSALFPGILYTLAAQAQESEPNDQAKPPTPKSPPESIAARCTASPGAPKTCLP